MSMNLKKARTRFDMCCLFGPLDTQKRLSGELKTKVLHLLAAAAEVRGTDASGIAYRSGGRLMICKSPVPGHRLKFQIPDEVTAIMGHTRMTTQGNEKMNRNNHPFRGKTPAGAFALAHNGVLWNDKELRESMGLPPTNIETDSYIAVQLIEQKRALDFCSLKYMAEQVEGSFTFTLLDASDSLYIVKGDSPLCLLRYPRSGVFVYASTSEILRDAQISMDGAERVEINSGEILEIDSNGQITRTCYDDTKQRQNMWRAAAASACCCPQSPLDVLKDMAAWMCYPPELIEHYIRCGYAPQEIEELLNEGEI